jgi:lysophospholipase
MRFQRVQQIVANNPDLAVGSVTFGWLAATFDSIDYLQQSANITRLDVPLLVLLAGDDHVVSNIAAQRLAQKMANCRIEVIRGARHEILQEQNHLQDLFWRAFDRFINC